MDPERQKRAHAELARMEQKEREITEGTIPKSTFNGAETAEVNRLKHGQEIEFTIPDVDLYIGNRATLVDKKDETNRVDGIVTRVRDNGDDTTTYWFTKANDE